MQPDAEMLRNIAGLPLATRRRVLRVLWQVARLAGRLPRLGLQRLLKDVLRVSGPEAARLEREIVYQDWITMAEWAALTERSVAAIKRDSESIVFGDGGVLARVAQSDRPVILAPIHMGCFALSFARIMYDHFAGRRMLILRAREDRPEETLAMRRISEIGIDMRFLNVAEKQNYVDAVRFAKAGSVIVTFVDLPASYGGATPVTLFGKSVQLAMGIGSLARLTEATVVPVSVHSSVRGDTVRVGGPFESYAKGPQEKDRIANIVRRHIEDSIRDVPEQWHLWPRFGEFLDRSSDNEAA